MCKVLYAAKFFGGVRKRVTKIVIVFIKLWTAMSQFTVKT